MTDLFEYYRRRQGVDRAGFWTPDNQFCFWGEGAGLPVLPYPRTPGGFCGLLSPEGDFYPCDWGEHDILSACLGFRGRDMAVGAGWVLIQVLGRLVINSPPQGPTEAQARFLNQIPAEWILIEPPV